MGLFDNMSTDDLAESEDRLGGFQLHDTNAYDAGIKMAYVIPATAPSKAQGVVLICDIGGKEYRETLWVSNKKGENFFINEKSPNKEKVALQGFQIINDICQMVAGKELKQINIEEKIVNVYDYDQKKELPKSVPVLMDLIDMTNPKIVTLGIQREIHDKTVKDNTGAYQPTGETREENHIQKVFHYPSGATVTEARNKQTPGEFKASWVKKWGGQVINKAKGAKGAGNAGAPPRSSGGANNTASATPSLFNT